MKKILLSLLSILCLGAESPKKLKILYRGRVEVYYIIQQSGGSVQVYSSETESSLWFSSDFIEKNKIR